MEQQARRLKSKRRPIILPISGQLIDVGVDAVNERVDMLEVTDVEDVATSEVCAIVVSFSVVILGEKVLVD